MNKTLAEQLRDADIEVFTKPQAPANKGHSLVKFFTQAEWAILPEKLEQLEEVLNQFISGDNVKLEAEPTSTANVSNVAVIPMHGTILKRAYGLAAISGVRTTQDIQQDIQSALDNPEISAIVLSTDSPGGTVDGTKELADFILSARETKPIVGYVDGLMASAAYWIGSACNKIVCYDTAKVGSVGVVVMHQEGSEVEKRVGVKTTFIYQGKYKTAGNAHEPLSDDAKAYIQSHVDTYYSMFVDVVSENRNINRDIVLQDIALGSVMIGESALKLNLVDSIGNLKDAITLAQQLGEEKMNTTEMEARIEELTGKVASLATDLATAQETISGLNSQLETANSTIDGLQEELAGRDEADAKAKRVKEVTAQFEGTGVSAEFIAGIVGLDDEVIAGIHKEVSTRQSQLDEGLEEFTEVTEGTTTEHNSKLGAGPKSLDEAIELVEKRDKLDIEEAEEVARAEFPHLFEVV